MFGFTRILVIFLFLSVFGLRNIWAESKDVDLDKIVVTPSRIEEQIGSTSTKVNLITAKEIQSSPTSDLTGLLTGLTGVNISDYDGGLGGAKSVHLRGSTAAQVLVMVDGRPINNSRNGEVDLSTIALDNIEKVEVVHGPGSSLYGSSAMGGIINILTKAPPKQGQNTEVFSSFGTFRTYDQRLSHGARIGDFGYLLNTEYRYSQGYRTNSEFDSRDLNTKLEYTLNNENLLRLNTGAFKSKSGSPGSIASPDIDDKQNNFKNFLELNWEFKPDDSLAFFTKVYNNYDCLEFMENTAGSIWDTANKKDTHAVNSRGWDTQINKKFTDLFQGIYGFNYLTDLNDSTTTGKHKYIVRAGYMENHLNLFEKLKLNLGTRVDDYSNFTTQTNPSFGAVYNFNNKNNIRGSIARTFRSPTFNELYWPDEGWAKGNPNLRPEKGITKEIGLDSQLYKNLFTSLTYFRNDFTDLINWAPDGFIWTPQNVNKARMDGIEWENKLYLFQNFEFGLNYTFLKAIDKNTRKDLVYQPRNKVDGVLKYQNINGFSCEFTGQFTARRFENSGNTLPIKKFYIYGFNLSQKINQNITGFLWLKNIFNRKYEIIKDYPASRFSATIGLKATF